MYKNLESIVRKFSPDGIVTDPKFSYYTISVVAKNPKSDYNYNYFNDIDDILSKCDCKLQFYYTDIEVDFNNKSNPFRVFLNSMFLQLNPELIQ